MSVELLERPTQKRGVARTRSVKKALQAGDIEVSILFQAPMVRAVLADTKHQTRRKVRPVREGESFVVLDHGPGGAGWWPYRSDDGITASHHGDKMAMRCPYGMRGNHLWVKETYMDLAGTGIEARTGSRARCAYRADTPAGSWGDEQRKDMGLKWAPSIFMPRWASRIDLLVEQIRVERVQDISEEDALAEGIVELRGGGFGLPDGSHFHMYDPRICYWSLWDSINAKDPLYAVEANPWAWAVTFSKLRAP